MPGRTGGGGWIRNSHTCDGLGKRRGGDTKSDCSAARAERERDWMRQKYLEVTVVRCDSLGGNFRTETANEDCYEMQLRSRWRRFQWTQLECSDVLRVVKFPTTYQSAAIFVQERAVSGG